MNDKTKKVLIIGGLIALVLFGIYENTVKKNELERFEAKTKGIITNYVGVRPTSFELEFKYLVDGQVYYNTEITSPFECENGRKGCLGSTFTVIYSTKNPEVSRIKLGKYNKYVKTSPSL
tara:strand:- start:2204 stop:2563 length:360 start_codon:yes stop_codon:yes gene_type:complete